MKHYQLAKTKQLGLVMIDLSPFRCEEFKPKETERVFAIDDL